jgi:hypothetical protein
MLIRIFSPTECGLIRDADLKKCGLNRMTTVYLVHLKVSHVNTQNSWSFRVILCGTGQSTVN